MQNTYEMLARAQKVNKLVNALTLGSITAAQARAMNETEWKTVSIALHINKPSEQTVDEVCTQLEGFERPGGPVDWERVSA